MRKRRLTSGPKVPRRKSYRQGRNGPLTYVGWCSQDSVRMTIQSEGQTEPIGARLRRLRVERGLSQRELSSPGVSYAYISRIEAGARTPSVKALRMLARKLTVSVEYLETGQDIRETDRRELLLSDAELALRLSDDTTEAEGKLREVLEDA